MSQVSGFTGNHGRVWGRYLADPEGLVGGKKKTRGNTPGCNSLEV